MNSKNTILGCIILSLIFGFSTKSFASSYCDQVSDYISDKKILKQAVFHCAEQLKLLDEQHNRINGLVDQIGKEGKLIKSPFNRVYKSSSRLILLRVLLNNIDAVKDSHMLKKENILNLTEKNSKKLSLRIEKLQKRLKDKDSLMNELNQLKEQLALNNNEETGNDNFSFTPPPRRVITTSTAANTNLIEREFYNTNIQVDWDVVNPTLVIDVDGDGIDEALVLGSQSINRNDTKKIHAFKSDGTQARGFPITAPENIGIPAANIADNIIVATSLNEDAVYFWSLDGRFKRRIEPPFFSNVANPVIAQVVPGGPNEIVLLDTFNDAILVMDLMGNIYNSGPSASAQDVLKGWPVVDDIDNDGLVEFVINSDSEYVYAYEHNGIIKQNFPKSLGSSGGWAIDAIGSPIVTNLNSSATKHIVSTGAEAIVAWNHRGNTHFRKRVAANGWDENISESVPFIFPGTNPFISSSQDNLNGYELEILSSGGGIFARSSAGISDWPSSEIPGLTADVDCDGYPDTIATMPGFGETVIHAFRADGSLIDNEFPQPAGNPVNLPRIIETPHNYPPGHVQEDIITMPGFSNISIELKAQPGTFTFISVFNPHTGEVILDVDDERFFINPRFTPSVPGDSIGIRLTANCTSGQWWGPFWIPCNQAYGYKVTKAVDEHLIRQTDKWPLYLDKEAETQPAIGAFFNNQAGLVVPFKHDLEFIPLTCPTITGGWPQFRGNPEHNGAF